MKTMNDPIERYAMNREEFIRQQQENMRWMRRCILVMIVTVVILGVVVGFILSLSLLNIGW